MQIKGIGMFQNSPASSPIVGNMHITILMVTKYMSNILAKNVRRTRAGGMIVVSENLMPFICLTTTLHIE